ncbi:hypothetical protein [Ferroacidibacillus organovorans]|uniref:DNA polymerase III subunit delta n=1 Tax=Ferroacidibacillus organovorans TaxID=1765683 RepID=A0A101XS67_9BACL|nr:hypothetical protein [Ferroacidibacillus organovorans]KUO96582.1 hypothetical protein ATW55_00415 [Ferroacidibacillus organovorans]
MDQDDFLQTLQAARMQGKLHHAYLLTQNSEQALRETAQKAMATLTCERGVIAGCEECAECIRRVSENLPYVTWLEPDGSSLKIAQMRNAMQRDQTKLPAGALALVFFEQAQRMTVEAANSILKWIEEPHAQRVFFLLTTSPYALLPTIRSRCVLIRLSDSLQNQEGPSSERFAELEAAVLELVELCKTKPHRAWHFANDRVAKLRIKPEEMPVFFDRVTASFRALSREQTQNHPVLLAGGDLTTGATHGADGLRRARSYAQCALLFSHARRRLSHHVNGISLLEVTLMDVADVLRR